MRVSGGCSDILSREMFRRLSMMMGCPFKMVHGLAMMLSRRMLA